jgi:hypothetical protein
MSQIQHKSMEDKVEHYLENFEELLNKPEVDHAKLMDQMLRVVTVLMRLSAKNNKHYSLDRDVEVWMHVNNVKGTFGSRTTFALNIVGACFTIIGGFAGVASAFPGTAAGNYFANTSFSFLSGTAQDQGARLHNLSSVITQCSQVPYKFGEVNNEANQAERTSGNAHLEGAKNKGQDSKESHRRDLQQQDRALQLLHEVGKNEHDAKATLIRAG